MIKIKEREAYQHILQYQQESLLAPQELFAVQVQNQQSLCPTDLYDREGYSRATINTRINQAKTQQSHIKHRIAVSIMKKKVRSTAKQKIL